MFAVKSRVMARQYRNAMLDCCGRTRSHLTSSDGIWTAASRCLIRARCLTRFLELEIAELQSPEELLRHTLSFVVSLPLELCSSCARATTTRANATS